MVSNYLSGQCRPAESNQFSHTASPNGNLQLDSFVACGTWISHLSVWLMTVSMCAPSLFHECYPQNGHCSLGFWFCLRTLQNLSL